MKRNYGDLSLLWSISSWVKKNHPKNYKKLHKRVVEKADIFFPKHKERHDRFLADKKNSLKIFSYWPLRDLKSFLTMVVLF